MKKLNLTFLALALACTAADCTPLIVGRTSQGYLIGTNTKASDGLKVCKVVYSHRRVLMLGGEPVALTNVDGSKRTSLFNIHRDLRKIDLANSTPDAIFQSVRSIITKDLESNKQALSEAFHGDPRFMAILVVEDGPSLQPQIWTEGITFLRGDLQHPKYTFSQPDLRPGQILEIYNLKSFKFPTVATVATVSAEVIESELERIRQIPHPSAPPGDQSFQPPYVIIRLDPEGVKILTAAHGPCAIKQQIR
jgi:hypothetical protein